MVRGTFRPVQLRLGTRRQRAPMTNTKHSALRTPYCTRTLPYRETITCLRAEPRVSE